MKRIPPDFAETYDEHVWRIYAFFAYRLQSRSDAEDLTQLTFERALRAWEKFDARRSTPGTWLITIARNLLIDHHRQHSRASITPLDQDSFDRVPSTYPKAPGDDLGISPDLAGALNSLSQRDREVVALRFGGDLTGPEIAHLLELQLSNVQQILSRSLRKLRTILEDGRRSGREGPRTEAQH